MKEDSRGRRGVGMGQGVEEALPGELCLKCYKSKHSNKKFRYILGFDGKGAKKQVKVKVAQSCPTLCDAMVVAQQAPLSMEFSRQECSSGLSFPSPGDLPDPK